jgi:hypothetical protein
MSRQKTQLNLPGQIPCALYLLWNQVVQCVYVSNSGRAEEIDRPAVRSEWKVYQTTWRYNTWRGLCRRIFHRDSHRVDFLHSTRPPTSGNYVVQWTSDIRTSDMRTLAFRDTNMLVPAVSLYPRFTVHRWDKHFGVLISEGPYKQVHCNHSDWLHALELLGTVRAVRW